MHELIEALQAPDRGFPEFHVKKELYWPMGKAPGPEGASAG
jgi:hypothetical protein